MRLRAFCLTLVPTIAISVAVSLPAQAQRARVFVSVNGNDSNPCTALSPCRNFQAAHDAVLAGGEISVLDTGGYGTLAINKAISIVAVGVEASIAIPSGGAGITINAGANDVVHLEGLLIDGTGIGSTGMAFVSGKSLVIENCVIRNLAGSGIAFAPGGSSASTLDVLNTLVANNGGHGIYVQPTGSGAAAAAFTGVQAINNAEDGIGIYGNLSTFNVSPGLQAVVTNSTVAGNGVGLHVFSAGGHAVTGMTVDHTTVGAGNDRALKTETSGASVTLLIGRSTIAGNNFGWDNLGGGALESFGDNYLVNNAVNNTGPPRVSPQ